MDKPQKIPVEFLLKMSRRECGELKSYIQELEDSIKGKDVQIEKLENKVKKLQKLNHKHSVQVQVDNLMMELLEQKDKMNNQLDSVKRSRRRCTLYKRMEKAYKAWYGGCKMLITLMGEVRSPSKSS